MRILHVCNDYDYWLNHRSSLAVAGLRAGHDVVVATAAACASAGELPSGLRHVALPIDRLRWRPRDDLRLVHAIPALARKCQADLVHLFTLKPMVLGGLGFAAQPVAGRRRIIATVAGLGRGLAISSDRSSLPMAATRVLLTTTLRLGLRRSADAVTFENPADRDAFLARRLVAAERAHLFPGAGVDLDRFRPAASRRPGPLRVLFAARLLRSKGVLVAAEAGRRLAQAGGTDFELHIAGTLAERDPDSLEPAEVASLRALPFVRFLGAVDGRDMPRVVADADIVVLPTRYPEGLPRVLLEGAACGAALIATDTPACRMIIEPGETGLVIGRAEPELLARAIRQLLDDPDLRKRLANSARSKLYREGFSIESICAKFLALYEGLR
jgi:glycosyltransferase involved in cell wall biosynthesis